MVDQSSSSSMSDTGAFFFPREDAGLALDAGFPLDAGLPFEAGAVYRNLS